MHPNSWLLAVKEERLLLNEKDDSYYLSAWTEDINLSIQQLKNGISWYKGEIDQLMWNNW